MGIFFRQTQGGFVEDRRLGKVQMLFEMADAIIARNNNLAGVGLFLAQDEFEERRFAVAVAPDQAQTVAGIHLESDVGEKLAGEIRLGKLVDLNHDGIFFRG